MIGTAVGHMLYNYSVGKAGPSKAAIFMNLNTLFTLIGSSVFLGEVITSRHIYGLILIVGGVILGSGAAEDIWRKHKLKKSLSLNYPKKSLPLWWRTLFIDSAHKF